MADKKNSGQPLQEEDVVARLKGAGGGDLAGLTTYTGLLSRGSREGSWLLYPALDMSTSVEIQESDIVHSEPLPPEQSPFGGLGGTLVFVRKGAQVTTTRTISRTSQAGGGDEFDLDLRVGQPTLGLPGPAEISGHVCSQGSRCETDCCPTRRCRERLLQAQVVRTFQVGCIPTAGSTCFISCGGRTCDRD